MSADEAEWIADGMLAAWRGAAGVEPGRGDEIPVDARPTSAVLVRVRSQIPAVEAALRCYHAGAKVTLSYRRDAFNDRSVKYWLLPELLGRMERGEIEGHLGKEEQVLFPLIQEMEATRQAGNAHVNPFDVAGFSTHLKTPPLVRVCVFHFSVACPSP